MTHALAIPVPLTIMLEQIGWELRTVGLDLVVGRAVLELHRADGRWLHVATDRLGRATIERWQRERVIKRQIGGGCLGDGFDDRFLGRTHCAGARAALRSMADYVAQNPAPGRVELPRADVRNALRLMMGDAVAPTGDT